MGQSARDSTLKPGARLGDLVLVREIGRGGQGVVYEARQESLDRVVAVKILPKSFTFSSEQVERFHREAEAAGRLSHPNIVAVHGIEETEGHHLIIQELIQGGSLDEIIEERRSHDEHTNVNHCLWAAAMCRDLARGLHHAHEHNVVHRDIKPANVLMSEDGVPKITDFGLAKVEDKLGLSRTGAIMGTPHYMSPEQVDPSRGQADARTDVYSLGALLYRLLTNEVPFSSRRDAQGIFLDILTRVPRSPRKLQPGVEADLEAVCLKALEKSPGRRYESAADLAEDLDRYLSSEPTVARPLGPLGRANRALRRLARSTVGVAALLVPAAWFALDVALQGAAAADPDYHHVRLGLVVMATLLLGWPLSQFAVRLARGARWPALPGWGIALTAGVTAGWWVTGQLQDQLHAAAYAVLRLRLELETVEDRRDVRDLDAYRERWHDRFSTSPSDRRLVAWLYLKRGRPTHALEVLNMAPPGTVERPADFGLRLAIEQALGMAISVGEDWWKAASGWREWRQVGDVLRDMGRLGAARRAYERAKGDPNAQLHFIRLRLAEVLLDLGRREEAGRELQESLSALPDHPVANLIAFDVALDGKDWETVERTLRVLDALEEITTVRRLTLRHRLLTRRGHAEEAHALLKRHADDYADDFGVVMKCAEYAYNEGARAVELAANWRARGDEQAEAWSESARSRLERAREWFRRADALVGGSAVAHVGLCGVAMNMADAEPERTLEHLADAQNLAEQAVALDHTYFEAHFNLGLAIKRQAQVRHAGSEGGLPLEDLKAYVKHYRNALKLNGLKPQTLNDTADALQLIYRHEPDPALLEEAQGYMLRALRLTHPDPESEYSIPTEVSWLLSAFYDTQRDLYELAEDFQAALSSAKLSLDYLPEPYRPAYLNDRKAKIAALQERLGLEVGAER